jgi:hypothetical protein
LRDFSMERPIPRETPRTSGGRGHSSKENGRDAPGQAYVL